MRQPLVDINFVKERQKDLAQHMDSNSALVLFSHPDYVRNNDVHHPYRQDSNFYYITGFEEQGAVFIFRPGAEVETALFVMPKDILMETWEGYRFGAQRARELFKMDECHNVELFTDKAPALLAGCDKIYYSLFKDEEMDRQFKDVTLKAKRMSGRSGRGVPTIVDSVDLLGSMRIVKNSDEIDCMEKTCSITSHGHIALMKACRPGVNERELHGVFISEVMSRGAAREGYGGIVASGNSATTLHYRFNDRECKDGDLLLVDAGAEYNYYSGDITRTFPVNGTFTPVQKRLYQGVLDVQKKLIEMSKPGASFEDLNIYCREELTQLMINENLLQGSLQDRLEDMSFKKYFPHGVGHWLGLDVHDAGLYSKDGKPLPFEEGMCFTIEPGLYIPANDDSAPEELRGIGIRIEDNILITKTGHKVLTSEVPKEVDQIEELMKPTQKLS